MRTSTAATWLAALAIAGVSAGSAQSDRAAGDPQPARALAPIPLEEVLRSEQAFGLEPSPDGALVAFIVFESSRRERIRGAFSTTGLPSGFSSARLRVVDRRSGQRVTLPLDDERHASWAPAWSPDGAWLTFVSNRDGHPRIWRWERRAGRLLRVSDTIVVDPSRSWALEHWRLLQWSADGRRIVVRALPEGMDVTDLADESGGAESPETQASDATATVYPKPQSDAERAEASDAARMKRHRSYLGDLVAIEIDTGRTTRLARRVYAERYDLSPNYSWLAFNDRATFRIVSTVDGHDAATDQSKLGILPNAQLRWAPDSSAVVRLANTTLRRVEVSGQATTIDVGPQSSAPVWNRAAAGFLVADGTRILRLRPSMAPETIATLREEMFASWVYADASEQLVFSDSTDRTIWLWTRRNSVDPPRLRALSLSTGELHDVEGTTATAHDRARLAARVTGQAMFYRSQDATHPPNFWVVEPGGEPRKLSQAGAAFDRYVLGEPRLIDWITDDGNRRRGVLVLPAGYQPGERVPMIVWLYPGLKAAARLLEIFGVEGRIDNLHVLASRGYAVLVPESTTKAGTPMFDLAKEVLPGVTKAVELGIADEQRLGLFGHSYGGYATLALITQTPRFRAAIAYAGFGNLTTTWGERWDDGETESIEYMSTQGNIGKHPWDGRELYIQNSPFFFLDRVETPLLLIHGDVDPVPITQSDQVYFALRHLGKPVEYARYRNVGHNMTDPANELDLLRRRIDWFDRHLKPSAPPRSR